MFFLCEHKLKLFSYMHVSLGFLYVSALVVLGGFVFRFSCDEQMSVLRRKLIELN